MIKKLINVFGLINGTGRNGIKLIIFYSIYEIVNLFSDFTISVFAPACLIAAYEKKIIYIAIIPIIMFSIVFTISILLDRIECITVCKIKGEVSKTISSKVFEKITSSDISQFDDVSFYEKQMLNMNNIESKTFDAIYNFARFIGDVILFIVNMSLLFIVSANSWWFIGVALIITLVVHIYQTRFNLRYNQKTTALLRRYDALSRFFLDYDYAREIKSKEKSDMLFEQVLIEKDNGLKLYNKSKSLFSLFYFMNNFSSTFILKILFLIYLVYLCLVQKNISYANVLVVYNAAASLYGFLKSFINIYSSYDDISLYAYNYQSILNYKNSLESGTKELTNFNSLEFRNVSFRYPNTEKDVLSNISFRIEKNQKVALVGRNGNGKTSLVMLLLRMYDPNQGEILVNGINIKEYEINSYRHFFGVVFQNSELFNASIKENISLGERLNTNLKDIFEEVGVLERINNMEQKEDSNYGVEIFDDGIALSGGEKQRLLVARALSRERSFLVMDEPLAYADPMADANFVSMVFDKLSDSTVLYITHRLLSTKRADRILVLNEEGEIEVGSHYDLLDESDLYRSMYEKQIIMYRS